MEPFAWLTHINGIACPLPYYINSFYLTRSQAQGVCFYDSRRQLITGQFPCPYCIFWMCIWAPWVDLASTQSSLNVVGHRLFSHRFLSYIEDHSNSGTIHDYLSSMCAAGGSYRSAAAIRLSASVVTVLWLSLAITFEFRGALSKVEYRAGI